MAFGRPDVMRVTGLKSSRASDSIAMDMLELVGGVTIDTIDCYGANTDPRVLAAAVQWREKLEPANLPKDAGGA